MQIKLSVVIITFNEEKNIARCLDSVVAIADEIVVVDSFSTDKTKEICNSFNTLRQDQDDQEEKKVHFIEHKFDGHIEQKNWVITQAKYHHVLSLDADEALTKELQTTINQLKNNWEFDGYRFNRLTNYCGTWIKHCGWYPDTKLRLWDTTKGKWGGENPHDMVIMNEKTSTKHINLDILHYSYYTLEDHYKQVDYFTDINSKAAFKNGKTSNGFKIFYKSTFKFFRDYILKQGFLDGKAGFLISKISAKATAMKYQKLRALHQNKQ